MILKLFIVMGLSWLMDILTTVFEQKALWSFVWDLLNLLQGVFIFLIFVFKQNILDSIRAKFSKLINYLWNS